MAELNQSIRSNEHKVAVDVLSNIVSSATEYADTIAKEQSEKNLVSKVKEGKKVSKADVEKLLPVNGGLGGWGAKEGNLDLLEVLFLESIFSNNKINAENVKTIADVIKSNDTAKKSIEGYLLEYFLVPLEAVWAADQYQNDSFDGLSDAAKKVFNIIYKDFLSTPEAIAAIDFTLNNLQQKEIEKDAFNLIITRCIEFDVSAKNIKILIEKGMPLIESDKALLSDLHSQLGIGYYRKYQNKFETEHNNANDTGDIVVEYDTIDRKAQEEYNIIKELVEQIETNGKALSLDFEAMDGYISQLIEGFKKYLDAESSKAEGEPGETPTPTGSGETPTPTPTEPAETAPETPETTTTPETMPPETTTTTPETPPPPPTPTKTTESINVDDVKTVLKGIYKGAGGSDVLSIFIDSNLVKDDVQRKVQDLNDSGDYDKQDLVKNALLICSQYGSGITYCLKDAYGEYNGSSDKEVTIQSQADKIVERINMQACFYKNNEDGTIQAYNIANIEGEDNPVWIRDYREDDSKILKKCHEITSSDPSLELFTEFN